MLQNGRKWGRERSETIEFAWRRRYGLPATDPRYLAATYDEILVDFWAHRFADDPKLKDEMITDDFDAELAEFERETATAASLPADDWEPVVAKTYGGPR